MTSESFQKELIVLIADLDAEHAIKGILDRHRSLGIHPLSNDQYDIRRHVHRDPGCCQGSDEFLRSFCRTHRYAIVMFDHHGSGSEETSAEQLELNIEARLSNSGWKNRCGVVVLEPELEIWVWSDSSVVDQELNWGDRQPNLRKWLCEEGYIHTTTEKPTDPKTALRMALREAEKPPSPQVFGSIARKVGLGRCQDRAFLKLKTILHRWFEMG